jgi:hypothetical protein
MRLMIGLVLLSFVLLLSFGFILWV